VKTINRGVAVFRAQAVSQKTRKQSASKNTKKSAAASRGASKGRAKAPVKGAKKAAAAKSSNKRSAMPPKNAKTVAKAAGSKSSASKAPAKTAAKAPVAKPAAAVKPVAAAAPKVVKPAVPPRVEEKKPLTQPGFKTNEFVVIRRMASARSSPSRSRRSRAPGSSCSSSTHQDKMKGACRPPRSPMSMRKLSDPLLVKRALETLKAAPGSSVISLQVAPRPGTQSRSTRARSLARDREVVRDSLIAPVAARAVPHSERQPQEAALDRLSREIAVVQHSTETEAVGRTEPASPHSAAAPRPEGDAVATA
jgi:CarD family transcriptional regulator